MRETMERWAAGPLGTCIQPDGTAFIGVDSCDSFSRLRHSGSVISVTSTQLCHYRARGVIFEQILIGMVQKTIVAPP